MDNKEVYIKPRELWTKEDEENFEIVEDIYLPLEEIIEKYKGYLTEKDIDKLNQQQDETTT